MLDELITYDQELLIYINNLGEIHFHSFWVFVTNFIYWVPLLLFVFYKIYKKFPKHQAKYIIGYGLFILFFSLLLVELVKIGIERIRPCNDPLVAPFINIIIKPENYSFFSGHATVSFALTTYLFLILRKVFSWIYLLFAWPLFFIYSRLYFGVHYPSDILIGMLVGIVIGVAFYRIYNARIVKLRIY
ncbi:phosphatase PAP2 family protein [Kordia sp. YSTF-M3]|uniref:Phosphatase PAP2 family protein n=1 Tax=Kordia aestuariivivens TaxID=2759037 RepID=A0ABR7Q4L9_9FLAO|nr:phosphatase PAP2 family protein [Kordia aestuariivivens]MBC8753497.1 phosphatase PAP2 family protein [Kordia aestuariivivens]